MPIWKQSRHPFPKVRNMSKGYLLKGLRSIYNSFNKDQPLEYNNSKWLDPKLQLFLPHKRIILIHLVWEIEIYERKVIKKLLGGHPWFKCIESSIHDYVVSCHRRSPTRCCEDFRLWGENRDGVGKSAMGNMCTCMLGSVYRKLGGNLSHIVMPFPPWIIKGGRGPL